MITLLIATFIAFIIKYLKNKRTVRILSGRKSEQRKWNDIQIKIAQNLHVFSRRKIILEKGNNRRYDIQVNQLRIFVNNPFGPVLDPLLKIYAASMDLANRNRAIRRIYNREEQWVRIPISLQTSLARKNQSAGLSLMRSNTRRNSLYL